MDVTGSWMAAKVMNSPGHSGDVCIVRRPKAQHEEQNMGVSKGRGIRDKAFPRAGRQSKAQSFKDEAMVNNTKCRGELKQDNGRGLLFGFEDCGGPP